MAFVNIKIVTQSTCSKRNTLQSGLRTQLMTNIIINKMTVCIQVTSRIVFAPTKRVLFPKQSPSKQWGRAIKPTANTGECGTVRSGAVRYGPARCGPPTDGSVSEWQPAAASPPVPAGFHIALYFLLLAFCWIQNEKSFRLFVTADKDYWWSRQPYVYTMYTMLPNI